MLKKNTLVEYLLRPRTLLVVWLVAAVVAAVLKLLSSNPFACNNFLIFRGVAHHFFASLPLYVPYPAEYLDINHYGPVFGIFVAPFAWLPVWLGMFLWVVGSSMLLYVLVRKLPMEVRWQSVVLWIAANDLYGAAAMQQFNILTAALIVGSFVAIQRGRNGWAALCIVIGTFVKLYGIVGLAFFFFARQKGRFILWMLVWSAAALLLPLLFVSPDYLFGQYQAWLGDLAAKNAENYFSGFTNMSMLGFVRRVANTAAYSDLCLLVPAVLLFLSTYLRWGQFRYDRFRLMMLSSVLIFVVIFSTGTENSGYITAMVGVGIWWGALEKRGPLEWTLLVLVLVGSFARLLFPGPVFEFIYYYALRAVPCFLVWCHGLWQMWTVDFAPAPKEIENR